MDLHQGRPNDRIKNKSKKWGQDYIDFIINSRQSHNNKGWQRKYKNYRYVNGEIDQEDFNDLVDTFGVQQNMGLDMVIALNKLQPVIAKYIGDFMQRPFTWNVIDQSPNAINEFFKKKQKHYIDYINFKIKTEIGKTQQEIQVEQAKVKQQQLKMQEQIAREQEGNNIVAEQLNQQQKQIEQQVQQQMQQIKNRIEQERAKVYDPAEIEAKFSNFQLASERVMDKLLKRVIRDQKVFLKQTQTLNHMLISGIPAVKVDWVNDDLDIEVLNPLGCWGEKSPEVLFFQDANYFCYRKKMALADIKRKYNLSNSDVKKLTNLSTSVFGMNSKNGKVPYSESSWRNLNKNYPRGKYKELNVHLDYEGMGNWDEMQYGRGNDDYLHEVYECYWRTEKWVGLYTYLDKDGNETSMFVDYRFEVPEFAETIIVEKNNNNKKEYLEWEDELGPQRIEYIWIDEIWKGVRVGEELYLDVGPMPEHFQASPDRIKKVKLPVFGVADNGVNAPVKSIVDFMLPFYKVYLSIFMKMMHLIATDYGSITFINSLFMDSEKDPMTHLYEMFKLRLTTYNPLQHGEVGMNNNTMKPAEAVQASTVNIILAYLDLLMWLEEEIFKAAMMPRGRLGQVKRGTNASDNERDLNESLISSERLYYVHDLIWEDALQSATDLVAYHADTNHPFLRDLHEDELFIIENRMIDKQSSFKFLVANNTEKNRISRLTEQHMHAMLQNQEMKLSTFLEILRTKDIDSEMLSEIKEIEAEKEKREQQLQQMQQQSQERQAAMKQQAEQQKFERKMQLEKMKLDTQERIEMMKLQQNQQQLDRDRNGVKDDIEQMLAIKKAQQEDKKLDLEQMKIENEREKVASRQ